MELMGNKVRTYRHEMAVRFLHIGDGRNESEESL